MERLLVENVPLANSCNGKGTCGKCKIRVVDGAVNEMTAPERRLLTEEELQKGIRLACMIYGQDEDLVVETGEEETEHVFTTDGFMPKLVPEVRRDGYGLAVDIGTTTVVMSLIDLRSGAEAATAAMINPQKRYGLDVLTRITYETESGDAGIANLQRAIIGGLNELIADVCRQAGISEPDIIEIDVAANCTMLHMLAAVDARPIGKAPYKPVFVEARRYKARDLGLRCKDDALVYLLPSVSAYIGADIVAGVHICDLQNAGDNVLFVDIGTNGELVLATKHRMYSCSCAAGPALEGMNITSGMRAAAGAVEDVHIDENGISAAVIGGGKPAGLCGSGILAVVRELVRTGMVTKRGVFAKPEDFEAGDYRRTILRYNGTKREVVLGEGKDGKELVVTQGDIRQVQLAKGAIRSGIEVLMKQAGLCAEDLNRILIAGQFGAHLPAESLLEIGLLPPVAPEKLVYAGNSAKTGAMATLLSERAKQDAEHLAAYINYIELSNSEGYERLFAKCLLF